MPAQSKVKAHAHITGSRCSYIHIVAIKVLKFLANNNSIHFASLSVQWGQREPYIYELLEAAIIFSLCYVLENFDSNIWHRPCGFVDRTFTTFPNFILQFHVSENCLNSYMCLENRYETEWRISKKTAECVSHSTLFMLCTAIKLLAIISCEVK